MNQVQRALHQFLQSLGIKVPYSVVRKLLDTPVGTTLRGISDSLDSLHIDNSVYQIPKEYLKELDYPYLMVLSNNKDGFAVITNDCDKEKALPKWEGVVLTAQRTNATPIYKYVWIQDFIDRIYTNRLSAILILVVLSFLILHQPSIITSLHVMLSLIGIWVTTIILKKENSIDNSSDRYCKIGKYVNCEEVLNSKGSRIFGLFRLSDMSLLFFLTLLFFVITTGRGWKEYSVLLLAGGCCFTVYSVIYQIVVVRKICLYCLSIIIIIWLDAVMIMHDLDSIHLNNSFQLVFSASVSYIIYCLIIKNFSLSNQNASLKNKEAVLYDRELFDWLLSRERIIEEIDNKFADVGGNANGDVITLFVHPKCKKCERVYQHIPKLKTKAIVKIISLASLDTNIIEYCKSNHINKTPTVVVNGRELPEIYSAYDLIYVLS